jgi:hypothetical protein
MNAIENISEIFSCLFIELSDFFVLRTLLLIFKIAIILSLKMVGNGSVRSVYFVVFLIINAFRFQSIFIA